MEFKEIIKTVNKVTGVDITLNTRKREVVEARALYYQVLRTLNPFVTLLSMANSVNKHHATIIYHLKHYEEFEKHNTMLKQYKKQILNILTSNYEDINEFNYKQKIKEFKLKISLLEEKNDDLQETINNLKRKSNIKILSKIEDLMLNSKVEEQEQIEEKLNAFYNINKKLIYQYN